jgi:hypothetical protein
MRSLILAAIFAVAGFHALRGVHGVLQRTTLDNTTPVLKQHEGLPDIGGSTFYRQNHAGNGRPTEFLAP